MQSPATLAVVIPNFNYARFLTETIESVLSQNPRFDEIIVVDDGSTDESIDVLAKYRGSIRIVSIPNGGQLGACRAGIKETTSDYIYTLDADDIAAPELVAKLRPILAARPAKIQFQLSGMDVDGVSLGSSFPTYPSGYNAASMRRDDRLQGTHVCPPTSGNVFSRSALAALPLETYDSRGTIDGSPMFAMPYIGEVVSLNEPLAFYRVHIGGLSVGSKPTPAVLRREIRRFHKAWDEASAALPHFVHFDRACTLFVLERELMIAGLEGKFLMGRAALRYVSALMRSRVPVKRKMIFGAWAIALLIPIKRLRKYLIEARRSSLNRPQHLRAAIALLT